MEDIWDFMAGYDRELNEDEFEDRLWEAINDEYCDLDDRLDDFCKAYGYRDIHDFLRKVRIKKSK